MQKIVNGLIEPVHLGACSVNGHQKELLLVCNEAGKLIGLPVSCVVVFGSQIEPIAGTCFVCLADESVGDFEGLPKSLFDHLKQLCFSDNGHRYVSYDGRNVPIFDLIDLKQAFEGVDYV